MGIKTRTMGKVKKRAQKYRYHVNRKNMFKKLKKGPAIDSDILREHWDKKTSIKKNLKGMGLCADPNKLLAVPLTKDTLIPGNDEYLPYMDDESGTMPKTGVIENIENVAASGKKREEQMSADEKSFIAHLLEKYDWSDLKSMAKDYKNYWQHTSLQIKKKIDRFSRVFPDLFEQYTKS